MSTEQEIMRLAGQRDRAMDVARATARFLAYPEGWQDSPYLRRCADQALDAALDEIRRTTQAIKRLKGEMQ